MQRTFVAAILFFCASNIAVAAEMVLDGRSLKAFDKSLSDMAMGLSESERRRFSQAVMKIGAMKVDLGQVASREEARSKSKQQLSQILNGKTYVEIMVMAKSLPNDARFREINELEDFEGSPEFQHDADIERLKHLNYLTGLIEEYYQITGHYPLTDGSSIQNYVYIASPSQKRYTSISPPYEHKRTALELLQADLEVNLGRKITFPYDPQLKPRNKPNFYIYMTHNDSYFMTVYLHNAENIGAKMGDNYYKIEISNVAIKDRHVITYNELLENTELKKRISEKYILNRPKNPEQAELNL